MLQHLPILITAYYLEKEYELYQSHTIIFPFQRKGVTLQRFLVQLLRFVIVYEKNINHKKR